MKQHAPSAAVRRALHVHVAWVFLVISALCIVLYASSSSLAVGNGAALGQAKPNGGSSSSSSSSSSSTAPELPFMRTPTECPAWIQEYAAFHRAHRGAPGAKYLVYSICPGKSGLGDRVRGMLYLTRLAAAADRVVLFTWSNQPHELHQYLPPAGPIDWTLEGIDYPSPDFAAFCGTSTTGTLNATRVPLSAILSSKQPITTSHSNASAGGSLVMRAATYKEADIKLRVLIREEGLKQLQQYRFITLYTNERLSAPCKGCPEVAEPFADSLLEGEDPTGHAVRASGSEPEAREVDVAAACLYRHLFGLSPAVQDAAQQQLERIYGRQASLPGFQYLALHMRLGGMDTEESLQGIVKGGANGTLTDLIEGVMCIRKLGQRVGIDTAKVPVLLFTDHHRLRQFIKQGGLAGVVTSDVMPTHIARMGHEEVEDPDAAISTYVDVALLARARCAVYSHSGFSTTAWLMGGGTPCYEHFKGGLQRCLDGG